MERSGEQLRCPGGACVTCVTATGHGLLKIEKVGHDLDLHRCRFGTVSHQHRPPLPMPKARLLLLERGHCLRTHGGRKVGLRNKRFLAARGSDGSSHQVRNHPKSHPRAPLVPKKSQEHMSQPPRVVPPPQTKTNLLQILSVSGCLFPPVSANRPRSTAQAPPLPRDVLQLLQPRLCSRGRCVGRAGAGGARLVSFRSRYEAGRVGLLKVKVKGFTADDFTPSTVQNMGGFLGCSVPDTA